MDTPTFSLVTTCKGRLAYLKDSLPTWLRLDYPAFEIVVVDFDCPDGTAAWLNEHREALLKSSSASDLRVVRVDDRPRFNLNEARNLGISAATSDWILVIDSDMDIRDAALLGWMARQIEDGRDFMSNMQVLTSYYSEAREFYGRRFGVGTFPALLLPLGIPVPSMTGTVCFRKDRWAACGGYDPEVNKRGFGLDDYDFYLRYLNPTVRDRDETPACSECDRERLDRMLARAEVFPDGAFHHAEHTDEERDRFYRMGVGASNRLNEEFIRGFFLKAGRHAPEATSADVHAEVYADPSTPARPLATWLAWWYPFWLGGRLCAAGEWRRASTLLPKALRHRAHLPAAVVADILWKLGEASHRQGQHIRAGILKRRALDVLRALPAPLDSERYQRAVAAQALGHRDDARQDFEPLCSSPAYGLDACFRLGELALGAGLWRDARRAFNRWLGAHPTHPKANEFRVRMWLRLADASANPQRRRALRLRALRRLESLSAPSPAQEYQRASIAQQVGQNAEAREMFSRLAGVWQFSASAYFHLGEIALADGNVRKAESCFRRCLRTNPGHQKAADLQCGAWLRLADSTTDRRRQRSLRLKALRLLEGLPSMTAQQRYQRASVAQQLGKLDDAREAFNRLTRHPEHGAGAHFHLGEINETAGRPDNARRSYRSCLDLQPRHQAARRRLAALILSPPQAA